GVFVENRTAPADLEFDGARRLAFDFDLVAYDLERFPGAVVPDLVRIRGIDFLDEDVGLIVSCDRKARCDAFVMAERDAHKGRLLRADHVPAWRHEVED